MDAPPPGPPYGDPPSYGYPPTYGGYPPPGGQLSGYPAHGYYGYAAPPRTRVSEPATGWALLACGVLAAIGSATPWASVHLLGISQTVTGTDAGDGKISMVCAVVFAAMGLLIAVRIGLLWTSVVGLIFAAFTTLVGLIDIGNITALYGPLKDHDIPAGAVSTGYGIWLVVIGGVLGLAASIVAIVRRH